MLRHMPNERNYMLITYRLREQVRVEVPVYFPRVKRLSEPRKPGPCQDQTEVKKTNKLRAMWGGVGGRGGG